MILNQDLNRFYLVSRPKTCLGRRMTESFNDLYQKIDLGFFGHSPFSDSKVKNINNFQFGPCYFERRIFIIWEFASSYFENLSRKQSNRCLPSHASIPDQYANIHTHPHPHTDPRTLSPLTFPIEALSRARLTRILLASGDARKKWVMNDKSGGIHRVFISQSCKRKKERKQLYRW